MMFSFSSSLIKVPVNFNEWHTEFRVPLRRRVCLNNLRATPSFTRGCDIRISSKWWRFNSVINVTAFFRRHFGPLFSRPLNDMPKEAIATVHGKPSQVRNYLRESLNNHYGDCNENLTENRYCWRKKNWSLLKTFPRAQFFAFPNVGYQTITSP